MNNVAPKEAHATYAAVCVFCSDSTARNDDGEYGYPSAEVSLGYARAALVEPWSREVARGFRYAILAALQSYARGLGEWYDVADVEYGFDELGEAIGLSMLREVERGTP